MTSNKKLGNGFERQFCNLLHSNGFWAHNMAQNQYGQPADVIAVKNGKAYLIDCKVCSKKGFALSRIEDNQELSMTLWKECGNGVGFFAFLLGEETVVMVSLYTLVALRNAGDTFITNEELWEIGMPFEKWVKKCK